MKLGQIKKELFYLRKALIENHQPFRYAYNRWIGSRKILKYSKPLERSVTRSDLSMHILLCHRDVRMGLWSLASFYAYAPVIGRLYIHSDGSLTADDYVVLAKFFPSAMIITPEQGLSAVNKVFAVSAIIKSFRERYASMPLLKKLLDPYAVSDTPFRLILDSDLGWFNEPQFIESACGLESYMMRNNTPCFVTFKDGSRLSLDAANRNSGIVWYNVASFNVQRLAEYFGRIDMVAKQNQHFIEQAGYAICLDNLQELSDSNYHIAGNVTSGTIMRHYTSPRRVEFYLEAVPRLACKIFQQ